MKQILMILLFLCIPFILNAQESSASPVTVEAVVPTGGNASGTGGSVAFSVGQVAYCVQSGTNGSIAQGVQQPYEIWEYTGIGTLANVPFTCAVFPNPVYNYLVLQTGQGEKARYSYQLIDLNGKLMISGNANRAETNIDTRGLSPSTYFLKVFNQKNEVKTFKIIKNR